MNEIFIILTAAEADLVRGETSPGAWLAPVPLRDGTTHVLPARVLMDPAHAAKWATLAALPQRAIGPAEWPPEEDLE